MPRVMHFPEKFQWNGILKNLAIRNADIIAYRLHVLPVIEHLLQKFYRFVARSGRYAEETCDLDSRIKWYKQNTMNGVCERIRRI